MMETNKTALTLDALKGCKGVPCKDSIIINQRVEDFRIDNCNFEHSIFDGVGIKNKKNALRTSQEPDITECNFSHCIFRRCYFRDVRFRKCCFVNCRFVDCDFPESRFTVCDLSYAQWQNTHIDLGSILSNLPPHENLQMSLLRSARMNFSNRGEGDNSRRCFLVEMSASADHFWNVAFSTHSYFRTKYRGMERAIAFLRWLLIKTEHWFWGYGESPLKLIVWAAILIALFVPAYTNTTTSVIEALRISTFTFATVGYADHLSVATQAIDWIMVESLIGMVFVGLLAATVFKWISRRQR